MKKVSDEEEEIGELIIHRDIAGVHETGKKCWCEPFIFLEDTLLTPTQIVDQVSRSKWKN